VKLNKDMHFKDIVDHASDIIQCVDPNGKFIYVNQAWRDLLEYHDASEIEKMTLWDIIHEDYIEHCKDVFKDVMEGKPISSVEVTFKTKNNLKIFMEGSANTKFDDEGNILSTRGIFRDVTMRKQADEEIKKAKNQLERQLKLQRLLSISLSAFLNSDVSMFDDVVNQELGRFGRFFNADRVYVFWYNLDHMTCNNTHEWCQKDIQPEIDNLQNIPIKSMQLWFDTHNKGQIIYIDDVNKMAKGDSVRNLLEPQGIQSVLTIPLIQKDNCYGFIGFDFVKDKHPYNESETQILFEVGHMILSALQKKKLEETLKQSEYDLHLERQRVINLIESSDDVTFEIDKERRYISIYGKGLVAMNIQSDDAIGKTALEFFGPQGKRRHEEHKKALQGEIIKYEWQYKNHNEIKYYQTVLSPLYDQNNEVYGAVGVARDITKNMLYQKEIEYMNDHDYLTDLQNRRYLSKTIQTLDQDGNYPLAVMMLDVNGLKLVNDVFGHDKGDEALIKIAGILKEVFIDAEVVARFGGDEFAIIKTNASKKQVLKYQQKLSQKVSKLIIENVQISLALGYEVKEAQLTDFSNVLKIAENNMYKNKIIEGKSMRSRAILSILKTLTDKYKDEKRHSETVAYLCQKMGKALGLPTDSVKELELAGLLHDIGKISIPDAILQKPGKLTRAEHDIIKGHTETGYQILKAADEYSRLAEYALSHHERFDGNGYPRGISGEDIPLFSRIISIVDTYEAMTSNRSYRKALQHEDAIEEIITHSGTQFDPALVKVFLNIF
jgi:diguanylate cyclase (GGDEF)-like protein/PAS domain S-box-containing protein/putative nucleotidyltransferase with HDIG domain